MQNETHSRLFLLGKLIITDKVFNAISNEERARFLYKHQTGQWHETDTNIRIENLAAIYNGGQIMSFHSISNGRVMVTTNDEKKTTIIQLIKNDRV